MKKTPLLERINRYILFHCGGRPKYIPIHEDDFEEARKLLDKEEIPQVPLTILGT